MTPPPSDAPPAAVELRGITKRFPGTLANDAVDLTVRRGEIHALMGENGAGKSTLMSVLYGMERPDAGSIRIDGREVSFADPGAAMAAGLGMVHQSFKLFDSLTVAENVVYAAEPRRFGLVDRSAARRRVRELAEVHGLAVDPDARVGELPVGLRQRVEILKLLHRGARTLILDEPTAVLTPAEADALFAVLKSLAAEGRTVILVTHKLREVLEGSDRVTVLRDGRVVARLRTAGTTADEIAAAMTGRAVELDRVHAPGTPADVVLGVRGLTTDAVREVELTVRAGEIVGIAGVAGNGQSELVEALAGLRPTAAGQVTLRGEDITHASATERRARGLAYVPEDRHAVGTAPAASVADNLAMGHHRTSLSSRGLLSAAAVRAHALGLVERFGIKAATPEVPASALSGGNLQKLLIGRELAHEAPLLLVEQPTRGVDIGAVQNIHDQLIAYRDAGHAVLLVSAELSEIRGLADRVLVMYEGRVTATYPKDEADERTLGLAMAGAAAPAEVGD
ncbi:heme ABC transporter ATP-binding protein [Streptomyces avermitilis]|uniref:Simple sugar ABC transporter ATP-binding protein n=2 Tax=Streptomyces avermitilis TaxID=33903 RepID=Q828L3_STRAW|nr:MULTISPECIES: ABC transporter ATP-binding protein [Streptomyces]KUN53792.1 heme ABC transporter ATP-binding protein [Streptomyces avermitilis]MYT02198.1 ATP-binding cassette domain-containing protein [Streptomyces sp. SID5469]OOV27216.1 heme ABC transporter ATP-binding protein [Streptomyces avermitilis]BAC74367.1 putative simple sugar ABC transporter ATP-binding protein [Streptomyces avermitilis MA-4680 = NBRC 14893]BBJ54923.1 ABC transporter [Streptomyces avermitilis]